MVSTFLTYQLYTRDMARTEQRIAADPINKRDSEYYRQNIGNVTSIDGFLSDYRLLSYALTAFGLEDKVDSQALIRKVLESDPTDSKSLVNRLGDDRYLDFRAAFDFTRADTDLKLQSTERQDFLTEAYTDARLRRGQAAGASTSHFLARIGEIENVDEFLGDAKTLEVVLQSVGLDPTYLSRPYLKAILTGEESSQDPRFAALVDRLPFASDGSVPEGGLMSADEASLMAYRYFAQKDLGSSAQAAGFLSRHYEDAIGKVQSVGDFVSDPRLFDLALVSVGLDPSIEMPAYAQQILTSDPDDPDSLLARMPENDGAQRARKSAYTALRAAFDFNPDGSVGAGGAQSADRTEMMVNAYLGRYGEVAEKKDLLPTSLFKAASGGVMNASQFVSTSAVYNYALKAFDLDPSTESRTKIVRVLGSDPSDPFSYARSLGDERYLKLAAAFNFDSSGKLAAPRTAQVESSIVETARRYADAVGNDLSETEIKRVKEENEAYRAALALVASVEDFVGNKMLSDYVLKAYGLENEKLRPQDLSKILKSDIADPESFANASGDSRYVELAAAFAFRADGGIRRSTSAIQTDSQMLRTQDFFLRQRLEEDAGAENEGVRLALFFKRNIQNAKSAYDLLADPRLFDVVRTTLGLPAEAGQADIDAQARQLEQRIDIESLKDPKTLDRFVGRFLAMHDLEQGTSGAGSPALSILGGSGMAGLF